MWKKLQQSFYFLLICSGFLVVNIHVNSAYQLTDNFNISDIAWSPDSQTIALVGGRNYCGSGNLELFPIKLWSVATQQITQTIDGSTCPVLSVNWNNDGTQLLTAGSDGVRVWDVSTSNILRKDVAGGQAVFARWNPDNTLVARASISNGVSIVNGQTGEFISIAPIGGNFLDWNHNGQLLASGIFFTNEVYIADMTLNQHIATLTGHSDSVSSVAWNPDSTLLASGSVDKSIRIWDVVTGTTIRIFTGHSDSVSSVAWNPVSNQLASASIDGTVRFWDVNTGQQIGMIQTPNRLSAVAWSPDGSQVAYGGASIDGQDNFGIVDAPTSTDSNELDD